MKQTSILQMLLLRMSFELYVSVQFNSLLLVKEENSLAGVLERV